jgi:NAD(P)-dependent dehydrogenase (short-subunit alcohol dehydrogenase family)
VKIIPGQVAAITGGGSGIGRALALACAARGMCVAVADIDMAAAQQTVALLTARGGRAFAQRVDVTRREELEQFAARTAAEFGGCDLLCNNAGVLVLGPLQNASAADWDWLVDVNLFGVVHGINAFLPRMLAAGKAGHILNTASLRGVAAGPACGVYVASKYAVLGLSETLQLDLADKNIGVTALCPWVVNTGIMDSERNRPSGPGAGLSGADIDTLKNSSQAKNDIAIEPDQVAQLALEAVEDNELYAITHPCARELLEQRFNRVLTALERVRARHPELP